MGTKDFIEWSHEEQLISVIIEDLQAISHLDEIMAVRELDYTFFGPGGLFRLDRTSRRDKLPECNGRPYEGGEGSGLTWRHVCIGVDCPWAEKAKKFVDMWCHMIELGHDVTILRAIWGRGGEEIRKLRE